MPVWRSFIHLRLWKGSTPNDLIAGRVDANAQVVGDKSGYTLTATSPGVIKSIQRGTFTIADAATTGSATISSVTTSKSRVHHLGTTGGSDTGSAQVRISLDSATSVGGTAGGANGTRTISYEVVEEN